MIPSTKIRKSDGNTGVVRPSEDGVLAIIAPSEKGTRNVAAMYTDRALAFADFGYGKLVEDAAYDMAVSQNPTTLVRPTTTTAGAYGTITETGPGTSAITAGATEPLDDFDVVVKFLTAGTIGIAGITYQTSLDGGKTYGPVLALGTLNTLTVLDGTGGATGVSFALGVGTVLANQSFECPVTGARMANADVAASYEALRIARVPWEILLIDGLDADDTTVSSADLWLSQLEAVGKFRHIIVNARMRNRATPESEATYRTALQGIFGSTSSIRVSVGADGGDLVSLIRGIAQPRPTSLALAARAMSTSIEVDAAEVDLGPVQGYRITDSRGNPKYHDEELYPGLDDLRLVSLRSFDGREGAYINNPNILSGSGSDYVFLQHARTMNRACEIVWDVLTGALSKGVRKKKPDPVTGAVYIAEHDAQRFEGLANAELAKELKDKVSGIRFVLSRTDEIGSNIGATLTGEVQNAALSYVKQFSITAKFARSV